MSRELTGSSRSIANMLVTLRQASFNNTSDHHTKVIVISARALRRPQHPTERRSRHTDSDQAG